MSSEDSHLACEASYHRTVQCPARATKRGDQRTPLDRDCDVLICGASFAGLAVARELAGSGAEVLVIDRYEIGERQTSACGIPTDWLAAMGLRTSLQQTLRGARDPHPARRGPLRPPVDVLDVRLPDALRGCSPIRASFEFETAKVDGRTGSRVKTDRGDLRAPLIVDALGWRRVLGTVRTSSRPSALLSRGLEVHPFGSGDDLEVWIDRTLRARRLRLELPRGRRAADRGRARSTPVTTCATDRPARRRSRRRHRPLPGQLDPARSCATPPRTASSSPATRPATACR